MLTAKTLFSGTRIASSLRTLAIMLGLTLCASNSLAQVAVTNPGNTTPGLSATYTSLALAIADLNAQTAISGPVVITLTGNETAPAGGYSITATPTGASAVNNIVIQGSSSTITANAALTVGALNDAIFKIIGADFITIQSFTMQENAGNTVTTAASNTMTEWGVALLHASTTNGAQNNVIQNNTISLNRTYTNTFGVYCNNRHSATAVTTTEDVTNNTTGPNSGNKVYGNIISNVNMGIAVVGSTTVANMDLNNDVGGTTAPTGNTLSNWGGAASASSYVSVTGTIFGIYSNNQIGVNVSRNSLTSAALASATTTRGIFVDYTGTSPTGTFTNSINDNTVTVTNSTSSTFEVIRSQGITTANSSATININNNSVLNCSTPGSFIGIVNSSIPGVLSMSTNTVRGTAESGTTSAFTGVSNTGAVVTTINMNGNKIGDTTAGAVTFSVATSGAVLGVSNSGGAATAALSMQTNDVRGIVHSVAGTSVHTYIINSATTLSQNISSNTFTNLIVNTTGGVTFISNSVAAPAAGSKTINGNSIVTAFNKTGAGGTVALYTDGASSTCTTPVQNNNNNFSNITLTGATIITGWFNNDGTGSTPPKTITGNTFSNWTCGTSAVTALQSNFGNTNTVSNNTITSISGQGAVTGLLVGASGTVTTLNMATNTVTGLSSTGTGGAVIGISCAYPGTANVTSNTVNTLSSTGASSTVAGIQMSGGTTVTVSGNTINTLSGSGATSPVANGLSVSAGTAVTVSKNKIYDIAESAAISTTSPAINGMLFSGGTTVTAVNNLVGDLRAPAASLTDAIRGISVTSATASTTYNVYYNTVRLAASSSGANFGTTGIFHTASTTATTAALNLRNNIIVNGSTPAGTGLTVAYRRSAGAASNLANYASTSNNNDFYAGTPGASNLIYSDGTSTAQTISAYKNGIFTAGTISPRDTASFTENPTFLSVNGANANFLHIDPTVATQIESGGAPIAGITDDFDGQTRNASTPDVGADEFNGIGLDLTPPTISYTALANTNLTTARTLTATITDATGVPTAGIGLPVLYWKINAGSYNAATASFLGGNQYQFTFGSGVVLADVVSYYVVAQDTASTPNVTSNPATGAGGFTANPPAAGTPPTTPNSYTILDSITGSFTVGVGGNFTTLTAAIADLNNKVVTRPVIYNLTDATYPSETFPIVINANGGSSAANTVTIRPAVGVTPTISGSVASGALIKFNGASFMTIDGSNSGGTDRSLTITNTNVTTPSVVWFGSSGTTSITNDTLKNCVIINGANTATAVVVSDGTTLGSAGFFNNMTIQNNNVQKAFRGVFVTATASGANGSGTLITQNDMNTAGANSIRLNPIFAAGTNGVTITNNNLGGISDANAEAPVGILLSTGVDNAVVTGNNIIGITSTSATASGSVTGILVSAGAASTSLNVSSNTISTLSSAGTLASFAGIASFSPNMTVSNNTISSLANTGAVNHWGIVLAGASNSVVSGNSVSAMTSTASVPFGINVQGAATNVNVTQNTVTNISSSSGTSGIAGILLSGTLDNNTVQKNNISGIFNSNTGTFGAKGIRVAGGNSHSIINNFVSDVKMDMTSGAAFSTTFGIHGIILESGTGHKVYDNSVNLFGLLPGTANSSILSSAFSIVSTASTGCDVRDNIFANNITGGTTSIAHVSAYLPSGGTSAMNLTWNNNGYFFGTNAATQGTGQAGTTAGTNFFLTLAALKAYSGTLSAAGTNDNASLASTGGVTFVSNTDLHINPSIGTLVESAGVPIAAVTTDIDGNTRNASTPDLGADEGNFTAVVTNDMQATAFIDPVNGGGKGVGVTFSPQASFTNNGTAAQSSVTVRYRIINSLAVEVYNQTNTIASIASGATTTVTFASTSLPADSYTIKAKSELGTDTIPANDEITGTMTVEPPLTGTYTVGSGGNFATLTAAFTKLNAFGINRPVTLTLTDASYGGSETFPLTLGPIPGSSVTNTVTIKPAVGVSPTIAGSAAALAAIKLNGADFVTIDGSNNGSSSQNLTITSANINGVGIWIGSASASDGANNNVIKNCKVSGSAGVTALAAILASSGTTLGNDAETANSNNTVQNNLLFRAQNGCYLRGNGTTLDQNWLVTGNSVGSTLAADKLTFRGVFVGNSQGFAVSGNTIKGIASITSSTSAVLGVQCALTISGGSITKNKISDVKHTNTGTYGAYGVEVSTGTNVLVANNFIADINHDMTGGIAFSTTFGVFGIIVESGTGHQIYDNSVNLSGLQPGTANSSLLTAAFAMVSTASTGCDVRDNIFANNITGGTTSIAHVSAYLPSGATSAMNLTWNNNAYYNGTDTARQGLGQVGTTAGTGFYLSSAFNPAATTPATNFRNYTSTLLVANTNNDNASFAATTAVPFVSSTDLHLATSPIPAVSGAGVALGAVTDDIDGDIRQTPPDIGADEILTYTVTYDANGGTGTQTDPNSPYLNNALVTVLGQGSIVRVGYTFTGWNTAANGSGTSYSPGNTFSISSNVTLFAQWLCNTATANAGGPYSTCQTAPVAVSGSATNFTSVAWSTSGTGTFTNGNTLNDTYNPSTADAMSSSVTLTLTAAPSAACSSPAVSNATLTFQPTFTYYFDGDSDGYGVTSNFIVTCQNTPPAGYAAVGGDCNDGNNAINPGAQEICDGSNVDEDCDGLADDNDPSAIGQTPWYQDLDGDGYGNTSVVLMKCDQPAGYVSVGGDCNDNNSAVHPGAQEICDGMNVDEDCDGLADDNDPSAIGQTAWYRDADGDGYGNASMVLMKCDQPAGYVAIAGDCDDSNAAAHPGAQEICDGSNVDEDCNGLADDNDPNAIGQTPWYQDLDGDGYGNSSVVLMKCDQPAGYVSIGGDCNDGNPAIHPGAQEICDGSNVDEDCDGLADDADPSAIGQTPWYQDLDGDGYGNSSVVLMKCDQPAGYVAIGGDCDDNNAARFPGNPEICDGIDNDCDFQVDEGNVCTPQLVLSNSVGSECIKSGETMTVSLSMINLGAFPAAGFQAFLHFDPTKLTFTSGSYTPTPFGLPIITPITATPGGDIDVASGINQLGGQMPTSANSLLVTLNFTATAMDDCNLTPVSFRMHTPPHRITDVNGQPISNLLTVDAPAIVLDSTPPILSCPMDANVECPNPTAPANTGSATAMDNCDAAPVIIHTDTTTPGACAATYTISRVWRATDCAGNFSECTQLIHVADSTPPTFTVPCPLASINVNADAGGCTASATTVNPVAPSAIDGCSPPVTVVGTRSDAQPLNAPYPAGLTVITWKATDACNNMAICTQDVNVAPFNQMIVSVQLSPTVVASLTRCIRFEFFNCSGGSATVDQMVTFSSGSATNVPVLVPCGAGPYTCVTARDRLHTLRRTSPLSVAGASYTANFTGSSKWLIGGNLNDDDYIDILDFGVFAGQFNLSLPSSNCSTAAPHSDINGDGTVFTADFTFVQINFLKGRDANCCGLPGFADAGPITRISVAELWQRGLGQLTVGDINGDGWLDQQDIVAFMGGVMPQAQSVFSGPDGGSWNTAGNWGNNVVPTSGMDVTIPNAKSVVVDALGAVARNVTLATGSTLQILGNGSLSAQNLQVKAGAILELQPGSKLTLRNLILDAGAVLAWYGGEIEINGGSLAQAAPDLIVGDTSALSTLHLTGGSVTVISQDTVIGADQGDQGEVLVDGSSLSTGRSLMIGLGGHGSLTVTNAGTVSAQDVHVGVLAGSDGLVLVSGKGSTLSATNRIEVGNAQGAGSLVLDDGALVKAGAAIVVGPNGELSGQGTLHAVVSNLGRVMPEGVMVVSGNYTQGGAGSLHIELGPHGSDSLVIEGQAWMGGTLSLSLAEGFIPAVGQTFDIVSAKSLRRGQFDHLQLPAVDGRTFEVVSVNGHVQVVVHAAIPVGTTTGGAPGSGGVDPG